MTADDGTETIAYTYDGSGPDSNPYRYSGEYLDFESGLYYLRARYYSPAIGRFANEDPYWHSGNMVCGSTTVMQNGRNIGYNWTDSTRTGVVNSGERYGDRFYEAQAATMDYLARFIACIGGSL